MFDVVKNTGARKPAKRAYEKSGHMVFHHGLFPTTVRPAGHKNENQKYTARPTPSDLNHVLVEEILTIG